MTGATVLLERPRPGIAVLTLNRPARLNALTFAMFGELRAAAERVAADPSARVLVVTGAGRGFCSGLDLDDAAGLPDLPLDRVIAGQEEWSAAVTALARLDIPVVAAVEGPAAGAGFSLSLAADIRVAGESARFNAAFVRIGLSGGDCGSSWTLPRVVGLGTAYELLLTGRFVDAPEALRVGLVNRVVPDGQALAAALETAALIAGNSPLGVRMTKQLVRTNVDAPSIDAAVELENRSQVLASRTADMREALTAFRERRPPRFTGA
jgi:enoyl-CoA hydratase